MNVDEYERLYLHEDRYWWFVARRELALSLVGPLPEGAVILDVGCGAGATARDLEARGRVVSCDTSSLALDFCRRRRLQRLALGDLQRLPFGSETADCVVALDVLEHVADDAAAIAEVARVLKPGGRLVLSTPAYPWLWSGHDIALHHLRRYRRDEVGRLLAEAGLRTPTLTYAVFLLFPLIALARVVGRAFSRRRAGLWWFGTSANALLLGLMRLENALLRRMRLPWGVSVVAVAEK
jgi:SAM-dependent methyltransferase